MSTFLWVILAVVYITLFITLALRTLRKGHYLLFLKSDAAGRILGGTLGAVHAGSAIDLGTRWIALIGGSRKDVFGGRAGRSRGRSMRA